MTEHGQDSMQAAAHGLRTDPASFNWIPVESLADLLDRVADLPDEAVLDPKMRRVMVAAFAVAHQYLNPPRGPHVR